jgi:hypothetical protein
MYRVPQNCVVVFLNTYSCICVRALRDNCSLYGTILRIAHSRRSGRDTMKRSLIISAALFAASLQSANAGLGESSSPQRLRCETQASAKFAMWQWLSRRDFVQRCMSAQGGTKSGITRSGKSKKRVSAR